MFLTPEIAMAGVTMSSLKIETQMRGRVVCLSLGNIAQQLIYARQRIAKCYIFAESIYCLTTSITTQCTLWQTF